MNIELKPIDVPTILDRNSSVLVRRDWLPAGLFPELDKLRGEHHELVTEVENASHLGHGLRQQYEAEDEARKMALAKMEDPPPVTGSAERKDRLEESRAFLQARIDRLAAFVEQALALIRDKYGARPEFSDEPGVVLPEWRRAFAAQLAEVDSEIAAARALIEAAEDKEKAIKTKERWLEQTVRGKGGMYLSPMQTAEVPTRAEWGADKVPESMSGMGMVN